MQQPPLSAHAAETTPEPALADGHRVNEEAYWRD